MRLKVYFRWWLLAMLLAFDLVLIVGSASASPEQETSQHRVSRIYKHLVTKTGLLGDIPPIYVIDLPVVNAYNTGTAIYIYQGIINQTANDDELALIIGHEMAHSTLMHFNLMSGDKEQQSVLESQADKMGAYYIMRAGYNICVARQFWKHVLDTEGDYLGADHPSIAYRYEQLNINCN